jgi:hypothetical protein
MKDPILAEVRAVREAYAERFNSDLEAMYEDLKKKEKEEAHRIVSFPPRRIAETDFQKTK